MRAPRIWLLRSLTAGGLSVLGLMAFLSYLQWSGNYHEIIPDEMYRSAQPTPAMLETFANEHGGRTVINLRGAHVGADWYDAEVASAKSLGLRHIDFPMSAMTFFSAQNAQTLLSVMRDAPKPILIHCKSGSDRTGFASMVYLMAIAEVPEEQAERQLSIRYGHFSVPYLSQAYPMDESWEAFERSIGITDS